MHRDPTRFQRGRLPPMRLTWVRRHSLILAALSLLAYVGVVLLMMTPTMPDPSLPAPHHSYTLRLKVPIHNDPVVHAGRRGYDATKRASWLRRIRRSCSGKPTAD